MKRYFYVLSLISIMTLNAQKPSKYPSFELWNKTDGPIYFAALSSKDASDSKVFSQPFVLLKANEYATVNSTTSNIDTKKYTRVVVTDSAMKGHTATVYTFNPGKSIWVRVKKNMRDDLVFGPQTGPYLGLVGTTERGYPKDMNVTGSDYTQKDVPLPYVPKVSTGSHDFDIKKGY